MNTNVLLAKLKWFANEAVCPVNQNLVPGYVSGAFEGWGSARNLIRKWLGDTKIERRPIPDAAICFFKDGNAWCCVNGDFINLQESPAGFGETFEDAIGELQRAIASSKEVAAAKGGESDVELMEIASNAFFHAQPDPVSGAASQRTNRLGAAVEAVAAHVRDSTAEELRRLREELQLEKKIVDLLCEICRRRTQEITILTARLNHLPEELKSKRD